MKIKIDVSDLHGNGVFATTDIQKNDIIEICPIIYFDNIDIENIDKTKLYDYYFSWQNGGAISLGYGSLYNHSYKPNALYLKDFDNNCIKFIAIKSIKCGEEITVNYNGNPDNNTKVWFEK